MPVPVIFAGQNTTSSSSAARTLVNYTSPLPTSPLPPATLIRNRRIESALPGSNYDPLVRWIIVEGIYVWWKDEIDGWTVSPHFDFAGRGC
ncbi:hypothetical protein FRC10_004041 [Ceratobasidium sp. 414]|nr:hypothetical protein FRC10_004041 [Ceratobasidium sp. 414]